MSDQLLLDAELAILEAEITLASVKANPYHDPKDGKFSASAKQRSTRLPKAKRPVDDSDTKG
ncbi:MAG: hypothetical protein FOGNACKC_00922 [Anaerolineae bacterium]|nr:hypothetical protein [Anaerolineae bacterium]